jgi:hypothetical protein
MIRNLLPLLLLLCAGCAPTQYLHKGTYDGIGVSYRWNHPAGKPSELLLRLENTTDKDLRIDLEIDLTFQGRTVETFNADTCMRSGQVLNGKLNGIYFVPQQVTTEQIRTGGTDLGLARTTVTPCDRP